MQYIITKTKIVSLFIISLLFISYSVFVGDDTLVSPYANDDSENSELTLNTIPQPNTLLHLSSLPLTLPPTGIPTSPSLTNQLSRYHLPVVPPQFNPVIPQLPRTSHTRRIPLVTLKQLPPTSIWKVMAQHFSLNHQTNEPAVQREIRRFTHDPQRLYHILNAATPYIYYINQQVQLKKLPAELALIPFVESEFNPNDHSNQGALGLWQLMRITAQELGVPITRYYDGRRNIQASTQAALAYFSDLGQQFHHNWLLAIAAYDCGQGKVAYAMRRAHSTDFWHLALPLETTYYVPRLLAVAAIIQHPEYYGITLPPIANQPYFTEIHYDHAVSLPQLAQHLGTQLKILQLLNADYQHGHLPYSHYSLLIPR